MSDLEVTFEESILDLFPEVQSGGLVSAAHFLALMEDRSEEAVEDALLELESRGIMLDISDLPKGQFGVTFHFYYAQTAGTVDFGAFVIAEGRDENIIFFSDFQDGLSGDPQDFLSVDIQSEFIHG